MNFTPQLREIETYLSGLARSMIRACARRMASGIAAFPPQVDTHYEAFWLRDFAYMLEGCVDEFSDAECIEATNLFISSMRSDGAGVDCVRYNGTPIYMPGYGTMGAEPVADGSQFTVDAAWHTWMKTKEPAYAADILPDLERLMEAMPVDPQTHLVSISSRKSRERCPYGFTDTVLKEGNLLFSSLLAVQAYRQLSDLAEAAGRNGAGYRKTAHAITQSINENLWDNDTGLYLAADKRCVQPDIWGSVFAVFIEAAPDNRSDIISAYLNQHHDELTQHGQIRHLPADQHWEATAVSNGYVPENTYQNGAYWATASGWYAVTLARTDEAMAVRTLKDMAADFKARGVNEWVSGESVGVPGYVVSAALPLLAIGVLLGKDKPRWAVA